MFKNFSVALLVTMFVVATPAFCEEAAKPAAAASVAAPAVTTQAAPATKATESKSFVTRTKALVNSSVSKAKDLTNSGVAKTGAAMTVVGGLISQYKWQSAALGAVATFALLYNYNEDVRSFCRGMVGCSDNEECAAFCSKRK